jgi:hypothetical protein
MIQTRLGYLRTAAGEVRRPTLRGIVRDRSAMAFITLALLGLAAVSGHLTGERLELRRLSRESSAWPRAPGTVLDTQTVWSTSPRSGKAYWPLVHYRYVVDGTAHVGDRVSFRPSYRRAEAEDAAARFPAGAAVSVWHRPGDPGQSVLEPGTWRGGLLMTVLVPTTIAVILLTLVSLTLLLFVSRPRR